MQQELTVIIPFLNEGVEVFNTVESIRNTSEGVIIILINDASTDNYDYRSVAKKFDALYIEHSERKGVAASRDEGVEMCRTAYFLLLDAHMRFYTDNWTRILVDELNKSDRVLLCCQTRILTKENEIIRERESHTYGAVINIANLSVKWNAVEKERKHEMEDIPCVLGAAYATSKRYWKYVKGLEGLRSYGSDEAYISLKVWLEGGRCRLLKQVVVGHIYREAFPYKNRTEDSVFNHLLIADTVFSGTVKYRLLETIKTGNRHVFRQAFRLLEQHADQRRALRKYYASIFNRDQLEVFALNFNPELVPYQNDELLKQIVCYILLNTGNYREIGLMEGKMGIVILLCHYSRYSGIPFFEDIASTLVEECSSSLSVRQAFDLNGLAGFGWGIEYLIQHGFMEGDPDNILEELDLECQKYNPTYITESSVATEIEGILSYVLCRQRSVARRQAKTFLFNRGFMKQLYRRALRLVRDETTLTGNAVAWEFIDGYTSEKWNTHKSELKEIAGYIPDRKTIEQWEPVVKLPHISFGSKLMNLF